MRILKIKIWIFIFGNCNEPTLHVVYFSVMSDISKESELLESTKEMLEYVEKYFMLNNETLRDFNGKFSKWSYGSLMYFKI